MKIILQSLLVLFALIACSNKQSEEKNDGSFQTINVKEFKTLLAEKEGILVDVRTANEVAQGKIPNAQHIDWFDEAFAQKMSKLDKSKPIFVYCAVGGRSKKAMDKLQFMGFKEVYNLDGGFKAWKAVGFEVEK